MKRLLSIILVAAMVIALIPSTVMATGGSTAEPVIIEFSDKTVLKADGTAYTVATSGQSKSKYMTDPACFEIVEEETYGTTGTTNPQLKIEKSMNKETQLYHMFCLFYVFRSNNSAAANAERRGKFTIKTPLLKAGKYSVTIKAAKTNDAGNFDVSVNDTKVGSFDAYDESATGYATSFDFLEQELGEVEVTPDNDGYTTIEFKNTVPSGAITRNYLSIYQMIFTEITPPAEDEALTAAFTPDDTDTVEATVYTDKVEALPYVDGAEVAEGVTATATQLGDGTYQMTTSTADGDNTFLYWVKGLDGGAKRVVSHEESFVYTPTGGVVNYLIAVYEKDGAKTPKAEFYNANGLLFGTVEGTTGTTPELPSMAGYGTAKRWVAKDATYAGEAPITVSETMMLIAEYDDPIADITITTENCTTNKPGEKYAYGEKVICTPTGEGTFYAWTKDGEIVSTDSEKYEFYAWEDCTVNAVYKEHTPITSVARKIIIDVFGNNVMAEFIGFDDAVEKGVILDSTKIAMTSKNKQFTIELGDATSAKGYAVVKNTDGTYTEYTDGTITLTESEQ